MTLFNIGYLRSPAPGARETADPLILILFLGARRTTSLKAKLNKVLYFS